MGHLFLLGGADEVSSAYWLGNKGATFISIRLPAPQCKHTARTS